MTILYYSVAKLDKDGNTLKSEYVGRSYTKAEGVKNLWEMRNKDKDTYIEIVESDKEPEYKYEV